MISFTVNSVAYALPVQTAELQHTLDTMYDSGRLSELVDPHAMLAGAIDSDWPQPPSTPWPRPRLGSLYWPVVGLAHYAFGCFLVDEYTLGQIRAGMTSAGSNAVAVNFTDDPTDDAEVARTVPMQFLAARPLVRTTADALTMDDNGTAPVDAWVVLLVDDRYRMLHTSVTALTTTAWSDIFAAASVTVADAVDSDYLTPGERWSTDRVKGRSLAWLMDIAALSVGSRIVNVPGSAPALQRPTGTRKTALVTAHTAAGTRFFGGGPIEDADVDPGMPNDVRVVFCAPSEATPATVDVTVQTTYAWPSTAHLTHWTDAPASTSSGNRSALAAQWEADWSAWQHGCYDTQYSGFVAAPASGFCWAVEWYHDAEQGFTRFTRPPHWYGYLLSTQEGALSSGSWKAPVRARTTAALAANTYANGSSGVGATLTGTANGALAAQDGVSLTAGQDLLVANEATASHNGIYTVTQLGDASHPYILTRRTDADEPTDLLEAVVAVEEGTTYADTVWLGTANATILVGTTSLPWIRLGITSPLTTKGDVWGYSTTDARIPVGADGLVLTADSTQALGVKWAAAGGGITSPLTTKGDIWGYSTVDARVPVGTNGQLLQADSTQALGVKWVTDAHDQDTPASSVLLSVDGTWYDVVSLALPSAGTYEITAVLGCQGLITAFSGGTPVSAHVLGQVYDSTNAAVLTVYHTGGAALTASWIALAIQATGLVVRSASTFVFQVSTAGAVTLKLQASRQGGPTWSSALIINTSPEPSLLAYRKLFA